MKDTIKTSRTAGYLEKIFRAINADWFGGELEEPIITIQSTPRAYGHVTVSKIWKSKGEERRHELNIGAETLQRPIENVVATIMHEGEKGQDMKGINQQGQAVYYNVVTKHGKVRYQIQAASGQTLQGRDRQKRKSRTFAQEHQAAAWMKRNGYEICG